MSNKFALLMDYLNGQDRSTAYQTNLDPNQELSYRDWVSKNNIPSDDGPQSDYDMRGFFLDPNERSEVSPVDGMVHFSDKYKTPYHQSFSAESKYAPPNAPTWRGNSLVNQSGDVVHVDLPLADEDKKRR